MGSELVSLESTKKYGYIASMIQVILPVVAIALVLFLFIFGIGALLPSSRGSSLLYAGLYLGTSVSLAIISVAGFILFMLSMYRLSKYYDEPGIFKNVLYAFVLNIVISVTAWVIMAVYLSSIMGQISQGNYSTTAASPSTVAAFNFIFVFLILLFVAFVFVVLTAVLYWRAFNKLAEKSGIESFKTAGLLYLIGSVLCIIGVGIILVWIAWIYAAKGYKQLSPQPYSAPTIVSTATPTVTGRIYCSYCGTENEAEAVFCKNCGKPLTKNQVSV